MSRRLFAFFVISLSACVNQPKPIIETIFDDKGVTLQIHKIPVFTTAQNLSQHKHGSDRCTVAAHAILTNPKVEEGSIIGIYNPNTDWSDIQCPQGSRVRVPLFSSIK